MRRGSRRTRDNEKLAGVYISHPFCVQKCTYCNFASGVFGRDLERRYVAAVKTELAAHAWQWTPETVYLGGGTPSRLSPGDLEAILAAVPGRPWREATIEAAPGTVTAELAALWARLKINRVSLGVQSFAARELAQTGRKHTPEIVAAEIALLRAGGISNFNIDLIAGLPGQTRESWRESLDWVLRLNAPHVSVYMLEVDEDSRLGAEMLRGGSRYGAADAPGEELTAELYETAVERLAAAGIARYEISNFARPGCESVHNLKYWRLEPYAGFGADAHSFDGATRRSNVEDAAEYVSRIDRGESACAEITAADREAERFYVGLRLSAGIEPSAAELVRYAAPIGRWTAAGLLEFDGTRLRLTPRGILLSNEVFQEFIP